jgi:hypothetical protein
MAVEAEGCHGRPLPQFPDLLEMMGPNFAGTVFAPTNKVRRRRAWPDTACHAAS